MSIDTRTLEEWKMLQDIITSHSNNIFKIHGWLLALLTALAGGVYSQTIPICGLWFFAIGAFITLVFFWIEIVHRVVQKRAINRKMIVEKALRGDISYDGPKVADVLLEAESLRTNMTAGIHELKNAVVIAPAIFLIIIIGLLAVYTP
jgi:hypothetical protein